MAKISGSSRRIEKYRNYDQQHYQSAWESYKRGDLETASRRCKSFLKCEQQSAQGWGLLSRISLSQQKPETALSQVDKALDFKPHDVGLHLQRASCLLGLGDIKGARAILDAVWSEEIDQPVLLDTVGNLSSRFSQYDRALIAFEKATRLEPSNPHYVFNLGITRQVLGDLVGAEECFDTVAALDPSDYEVHWHRSRLRKQTISKNHISEIEAIIGGGLQSWRGQTHLHYSLGKEYEDLGNYESSFQHIDLGAKARRSHIQYSVEADVEVIDSVIANFSNSVSQENLENASTQEPVVIARSRCTAIFVVGLPRTGTTLVERIIGRHPNVSPAGELNYFPIELEREAQKSVHTPIRTRIDLVEAARKIDFRRLGRAYIDRVLDQLGSTSCFTDKQPSNFLYCGLIHAALPDAKIVHVTRHPVDTCFAIFKTLFDKGYPYSYDLEELASYYIAYKRLMDHWHKTIPGVIHEVAYEDLVGDQEGESRRLVEHSGLQWNRDCLDFHHSRSPSVTASAAQVRQPIYDTSIGRWRKYGQQLAPLVRQLRHAGIDIS